MKTAISVASVLACAFSLDAQITTRLNHLPDGLDEVRIRNNSATSLVAFVVSAKWETPGPSELPFVVYSDPLIEPSAKPLAASEERVVKALRVAGPPSRGASRKLGPARPIRLLEDSLVSAEIFADGVTSGDGALITRLMLRRSNYLLAVEITLETLSDAGRRNVSRDHLIGQFKKMADSLRRWYLLPEQQIGLGVYQSIIGKLMSLPEGQLGAPFPPATFVEEETTTLRQCRVTLSESQPSLADAARIGSLSNRP